MSPRPLPAELLTRARPGTVVPAELEMRSGTAAYAREWRERRPELHALHAARTRARAAAALRVAKNHPEEFACAIRAEERRRGLR